MERDKLDGIRIDIIAEVYGNRGNRFTRFKRALWYGSRGRYGGYLGDGKGLRKTIRDAPKKILIKNVSGMIGAPLKLVMAPVTVIPVIGPMITGAISGLVTTSLEDLILKQQIASQVKKVYTMKVEDGSSYKTDLRNWMQKTFNQEPISADEELRKQIKHEVKDMATPNGLLVIDRNLVKMKDAKARMESAIKRLEMVVGNTKMPSDGRLDDNFYEYEEKKMEAANDVLVDIVETGYYIKKVTGLVETMQAALTKIRGELKELDKGIDAIDQKVENYILENL